MTQQPLAPAGADEVIGERVVMAMWRARVQQKELAAALGLDQASVSRRLRGRISWKVTELIAAAELLGVPVTDLLPGEALASTPRRRRGSELGAVPALTREDVPAEFK